MFLCFNRQISNEDVGEQIEGASIILYVDLII